MITFLCEVLDFFFFFNHKIINLITHPAASSSYHPPLPKAFLGCFKTNLRHADLEIYNTRLLDSSLHFRILDLVGPSEIFWSNFLVLGKSSKVMSTLRSDTTTAPPKTPRHPPLGLRASWVFGAHSVHTDGRPAVPGELLPFTPATFCQWETGIHVSSPVFSPSAPTFACWIISHVLYSGSHSSQWIAVCFLMVVTWIVNIRIYNTY